MISLCVTHLTYQVVHADVFGCFQMFFGCHLKRKIGSEHSRYVLILFHGSLSGTSAHPTRTILFYKPNLRLHFRLNSKNLQKSKSSYQTNERKISISKNRTREKMPAHENTNSGSFNGHVRLHKTASPKNGNPFFQEIDQQRIESADAYDEKRLRDAIRKIVERSPVEAKPTPCRRAHSEPYSTVAQPSAFNRRKNKKGLSLSI